MRTPTISLRGSLYPEYTERKLQLFKEFEAAGHPAVELNIESGGGHTEPALAFYHYLAASPVRVEVKVRRALSAAALIALCGDTRQILDEDSQFSFHLGCLFVEIVFINKSDYTIINRAVIDQMFKDHDEMLQLILEKCPALTTKMVTRLVATGWLHLTGKECVELGICDGYWTYS